MLAVGVNDVFINPVSKRNSNCIEAVTSDLGDIVLGDPTTPMCLECGIGCSLAKGQDTVKLTDLTCAAHCGPFVVHHPWLNDKKTAEIDTADFPFRKPCIDECWKASQS